MDKIKQTPSEDDNNNLSQDDMDMLETVLKRVRGSYPGSPYRAADYLDLGSEV